MAVQATFLDREKTQVLLSLSLPFLLPSFFGRRKIIV
jgi:hypothetical protein